VVPLQADQPAPIGIVRVHQESGFASDPAASASAKAILDEALFCFGVLVANYARLNSCSLDTAAGRIDSGINVAQDVAYGSYRYLGIPEGATEALVPLDSDGISDVSTLSRNKTYLMWNVYHAVFATEGVFDNYGDPLPTRRFVQKHHSLWRGNRVWALRFK